MREELRAMGKMIACGRVGASEQRGHASLTPSAGSPKADTRVVLDFQLIPSTSLLAPTLFPPPTFEPSFVRMDSLFSAMHTFLTMHPPSCNLGLTIRYRTHRTHLNS